MADTTPDFATVRKLNESALRAVSEGRLAEVAAGLIDAAAALDRLGLQLAAAAAQYNGALVLVRQGLLDDAAKMIAVASAVKVDGSAEADLHVASVRYTGALVERRRERAAAAIDHLDAAERCSPRMGRRPMSWTWREPPPSWMSEPVDLGTPGTAWPPSARPPARSVKS
jgi:hypothetical protein